MVWRLTYFATDLLTFEILGVKLLLLHNLSYWIHFLRVAWFPDFFPPYILVILHVVYLLSLFTCIRIFSPAKVISFIRAHYGSVSLLYFSSCPAQCFMRSRCSVFITVPTAFIKHSYRCYIWELAYNDISLVGFSDSDITT